MNNRLKDSGRAKRYSKFEHIKDSKFQRIFDIVKSYEENQSKVEKSYKKLSQQILLDTQNYKEKAIVIDSDDKIVFAKIGERSSVVFTDEELKLMNGCTLIHNHPSGMTLSEADIKLALHYNLKEIVAFSAKGKFYKLTINDKHDKKELVLKYADAKKEVQRIMLELSRTHQVSREHIKAEYQNFITSLFADSSKGVKYEISN